jgi:hypothetical protein
MPNWCYNKLVVKSNGDLNEFRRFIEQGRRIETYDGDEENVWRISNYLPTPEGLLSKNKSESEKMNLKNTLGFDNAYEWRLFYWGTKWDCDNYGFESYTDENSIFETDFDSAWSPPTEFLINVSIMYPSLSFQLEYLEPGMSFAGTTYINNGFLLDICSDPVHKNEDGEIINVEYDDDNEMYILSNGLSYNEDEWFDNELSIQKNPFENLKY